MAEARLVQVDVSLAGGHRQRLHLESDSEILRALLEALAARLAPGPRRVVLFQIPLEDGRSALTFTSDQLVALTTTPPALVHAEDVVVTRGALTRIHARHVRFQDVLGASAKARLLEHLAACRLLSLPQLARLLECENSANGGRSQSARDKSARRHLRALFDAGLVDVLPVSRAALAPGTSPLHRGGSGR